MNAGPTAAGAHLNRMADKLLKAGLLNDLQVETALREHQRRGGNFRTILSDLGFLDDHAISAFLAREAHTVSVDVRDINIPSEVLKLIPYPLAKRCVAIPVWIDPENGALEVAFADPFDVTAMDAVAEGAERKIKVVTAPEKEILAALEAGHQKQSSIESTIQELLRQKPVASLDEADLKDPPLIRLVEQILTSAIEIGASDIHVEPDERILRIRLRVDGVLRETLLIPKTLQAAITARLKIIAGMDLTETRLPQDGRASFQAAGRDVNFRISSLPTSFGENIVLRLLDRANMNLKLSDLGLTGVDLERFMKALHRPYGVILVTGPTGSGKTTTLYSALSQMNVLARSIYTLEDPIEYRLPVIRQTQIHEEVGMTFARGLRALLRQDPNVILVGETRDSETAELMVRAALTGHLVFSTLHTNDAAGAIPRLLDMGVEPYLLPAVIEAIVAQRLVRVICNECKEPGEDAETAFAELGLKRPPGAPDKLWHGRGCEYCNHTGYKGRVGLFEVLMMHEQISALAFKKAGADEINQMARKLGMTSIFEDGLRKVANGTTTLQEVLRVTRSSDRQPVH